ncbi:MAG: class I SAM-dependent methyltransferase [Pseudomonadota bacterium]
MSPSLSPEFASQQDRWNQRFSAPGHLFGAEPNAWLREHTGLWPKDAHVLSVADGDGRNSVWLASQGLQVDAFDFSEVGVAKARDFAKTRGVTVNFSVSDCDSYPWPKASLDGVAAIFIQFADPEMRTRMFARMVESLKPGGLLVLQGYSLGQLAYRTGGPSEPSHLYTEPLLRDAFAELEILKLESHEAELAEGSAHSGRSALISLLARRP